jgi:hypothetical protein
MSYDVGDFIFHKLFLELNQHGNCGIPCSIFLSIIGDCLATRHHISENHSHSQSLAVVLVIYTSFKHNKSETCMMLINFRHKINNLNFEVLYICRKQIIFKNEG